MKRGVYFNMRQAIIYEMYELVFSPFLPKEVQFKTRSKASSGNKDGCNHIATEAYSRLVRTLCWVMLQDVGLSLTLFRISIQYLSHIQCQWGFKPGSIWS